MSKLTLKLNINSASNLPNVNLLTKMDVYAVISIHGDGGDENDKKQKKKKVKTAVHRSCGSNPTWNHAVEFPVNEKSARDGLLTLVVRLVSHRVLGNTVIGGVNVPLLELLNQSDGNGNGEGMKFVTYQVTTLSGERKGSLTFSYRFKPDFSVIVNRSFVDPVDNPPPSSKSVSLPSRFEHLSPSAPPEPVISYPPLYPVVDGSSYGIVPYGVATPPPGPPYFCSASSHQFGYGYHHAPPPMPQSSNAYFPPPSPPIHQGSIPYAPPSPARYRFRK
ncbi:unnamed protein product [Cochlearia groenlandica]